MFSRLLLYERTLNNLKLSQVIARTKKLLGLNVSLGVQPRAWGGQIAFFKSPRDLDFDPIFLSRFNADEFAEGKVTFLHETVQFDWNDKWNIPNRSPLWNFNLHYFEYLMAFVEAYKRTQDKNYLRVIKNCINGWIDNNPVSAKGNGWSAYTIAIRVVYWFSCLFELSDVLDKQFKDKVIVSLYEQYFYLSNHLEKDLLANHYFEDLKALILCAIAFNDEKMLNYALNEFKVQCKEQILPDGMHFEVSPMYHKIVLEALMRTAVALRSVGKVDTEIESFLQKMVNVAFSLEEGLNRVPLFNDGGNNVAKSLDAILITAKNDFDILPVYKCQFPDSGFYIFKWNGWKMIVDAGAPGPKYNAGHAHCDAMSYELFYKGKPVIVNCGTFAYQDKERAFFRSTKAHNTVMVEGIEQSECWSVFRMGKQSKITDVSVSENSISIEMCDQKNNSISRLIKIYSDTIEVIDKAENKEIVSYLHCASEDVRALMVGASPQRFLYSEEYGRYEQISGYKVQGKGKVTYKIIT